MKDKASIFKHSGAGTGFYAGAGGLGEGCRPRGAGDVWNVRKYRPYTFLLISALVLAGKAPYLWVANDSAE